MDYYVLERYARKFGVLQNRVKFCNQLLGASYLENRNNPYRLVTRRGTVSLMLFGSVVRSFSLYDLDGVSNALDYMTDSSFLLWNMTRNGYVNTNNHMGATFVSGEYLTGACCVI